RAVVVAGTVEPAAVVETRDLDYERVAFPMSVRPTHPAVDGRLFVLRHVHDAIRAREFVDEQDVAVALHDLERIRHVRRARNPRHVALGLGIRLRPALTILFALSERLGLVRNRAALDDALTRGARGDRAELPEVAQARSGVVLEIPIGAAHRLPDSVHVRLAAYLRWVVGGTRPERREAGDGRGAGRDRGEQRCAAVKQSGSSRCAHELA